MTVQKLDDILSVVTAAVGPTDLATPTLMRAARGAYAQSIRVQLDAIGIDDLPKNGALILAGIDATGGPRHDLPAGLGITKQAVSQLVDTLVVRGYVVRSPDPDDRRRIALELTPRGREAVDAVARGVDSVDRQLLERLSPEQVGAMREALYSLATIKTDAVASGAGGQRQLRRFSPIFPVRNLGAALAHYASLGFECSPYAHGDGYGFADRDGVGLHLEAESGHEHEHVHVGSAYLNVRDADALYAEWSRPGIGGHTAPVAATPYGLREGSHTDPDGNLIRFGSPAED